MKINKMNNYNIKHLKWDTDFFGLQTAKVLIQEKLNKKDIDEIIRKTRDYEFVVISDQTSDYYNDYLIGKYTNAYLVDNNVQLTLMNKKNTDKEVSNNIQILNNHPYNEELLSIAVNNIKYSKYFNDPHIVSNKGAELYMHWTKNSFMEEDKYFITYKDNYYKGFLLFSLTDDIATIELLIIDKEQHSRGLGTLLIHTLKNYLADRSLIHVGTQIDNIEALNFYVKNGFKIKYNQRTYHKWN